jgi:hypothetical protein
MALYLSGEKTRKTFFRPTLMDKDRKLSFTICDFDDVMLGSSAIF